MKPGLEARQQDILQRQQPVCVSCKKPFRRHHRSTATHCPQCNPYSHPKGTPITNKINLEKANAYWDKVKLSPSEYHELWTGRRVTTQPCRVVFSTRQNRGAL